MDINYILSNNNRSDEEERKEKYLAKELLAKYLEVRLSRKTNKGNKVGILISNANGFGVYNSQDYSYNLLAGLKYASLIGKRSELINQATSEDLQEIIRDKSFSDIYLIGHSSHDSWLASDKQLNWFDLGCMIKDHLKNGIFANTGCGGINSLNKIPLGYFVVSNHKNLLGQKAQYTSYLTKNGNLSDLTPLRKIPSLTSLIE